MCDQRLGLSVCHHIKTHNSESRGQEEAGCMQQMSELLILHVAPP